ncbi:MAG: hypothetical protein N0A16_00045 [Blastocatellia bacterium]|nr:hypothetical protein [Blastocatellia bacterium]MCS7156100.1 hypothetical protein [Blastocatellia bacterium]MDW8169263.1 hypothetical protein [Acidobacteriota bacterium]MDW8256122.1 hypothetical protein [Acidobacteriota bacterium]
MRMTLEEVNHHIRIVSQSLKAFMRSERRALLRSALFDVPRRSSLGWECLYRTAYPLLAEMTTVIAPEAIGRRMKRVCARPNFLTLSVLICCYLGGRQQHILDLGVKPGEPFPEDDLEQIGFVVDFWRRVCRAYREADELLPNGSEATMRILPSAAIAALRNHLVDADPLTLQRLRRMAATLELYAFILHGEQRDGLFAHGPYALDDRDVLVVREFTDLQNTYLPWAQTRARNPYPNLALALVLRDVKVRFDLFGGVHIEPSEYADRVRACALLTARDNGAVCPVPFEEIAKIEARAADAQLELYRVALSWSPRFRIEYGLHLFANHMKTFFDIAGMEAGERIRRAFQEAAAPFLRRLLDEAEPPSIWPFMATTEGDFFYPVSLPQ